MKLYELKSRGGGQGIDLLRRTEYGTSQQWGLAQFNATKKALKALPTPRYEGTGTKGPSVVLNLVELRTTLVAADWCALLQADAPGIVCDLTPQDLITSRKEVKSWARGEL